MVQRTAVYPGLNVVKTRHVMFPLLRTPETTHGMWPDVQIQAMAILYATKSVVSVRSHDESQMLWCLFGTNAVVLQSATLRRIFSTTILRKIGCAAETVDVMAL